MNNLKQIEQLRKLHGMIKLENTGSPNTMAKKMHVSERQLYNLIDQLRTMDAPIRFNRRANTYFYTRDFELLVNISVKVIQGNQVLQIYAGEKVKPISHSLQGLCSRENYLGQVMTYIR
jgi:predicted DNA-binding transcriptional regulator YafY